MNYKAHERFAKIVIALTSLFEIGLLIWAYLNWP